MDYGKDPPSVQATSHVSQHCLMAMAVAWCNCTAPSMEQASLCLVPMLRTPRASASRDSTWC